MGRIKWILLAVLLCGPRFAFADDMVWQTPFGTFGLPFQATEAVLGYDAILHQSIAGASLPVYQSLEKLLALQVGVVGAWPNNGAAVEPYVAGGLDVLREIPKLKDFESAHINVFGRYASERGKVGMGVSFSYSFALPKS